LPDVQYADKNNDDLVFFFFKCVYIIYF